MTLLKILGIIIVILVLLYINWIFRSTTGTVGYLSELKPVEKVDWNLYAGTWFELKRVDSWFQKNLTNVTANYSALPNGKIRIVNSGRNSVTGEIEVATGEARTCSDNTASLLVSFFPYIEAPYVILYLASDYSSAIVGSPSRKYLWLLSRSAQVNPLNLITLEIVALYNGYTQATINSMI